MNVEILFIEVQHFDSDLQGVVGLQPLLRCSIDGHLRSVTRRSIKAEFMAEEATIQAGNENMARRNHTFTPDDVVPLTNLKSQMTNATRYVLIFTLAANSS